MMIKKFTKKQIGDIGEDYAVKYLKKHRYKIIERNFQRPYGEIDIIAEKKNCLVFVEVKTRKFNTSVPAAVAVNYSKQKKLKKTAEYYIGVNKIYMSCRFDVCEVYVNSDNLKLFDINYIENAF